MKSFVVAGMMLLSNLAMASQSYVMEVFHQHLGGDEYSQQIRSYTDLQVSSEAKLVYRLQATSTTKWQQGAQFMDVQGVVLNYAPAGASKATIYQVDGNHMGSIQTQLSLNCGQEAQVLSCSTKLENGNDLYIVIAR
jgi:hypothetical protein